MKPWRVPAELKGRTVAILASGPSMSAAVADQVRAAGAAAIAVNTTFRLAPDAWAVYAADREWWAHHPEAMQHSGHKISCSPVPGTRRLLNVGSEGWTEDPACVHTYGNSGAQAIQVAIKAGAARVLLCGFDMRGGHWHPDHKRPLRTTPAHVYKRWCEQMKVLASHLNGRCEILNCTPQSAVRAFPLVDLTEALARE